VSVDVRRGSGRAPTLYDVAREAGVSHQTVSRLLKGEGIRPGNRERIESAIAALDYRPNPTARALATNSSRRIGALVYELQELGPSRITQGAADAARRAGYLLDIVTLDPGNDRAIREAIDLLDQRQLAGILALAPTERVGRALREVEYRIPVHIASEPLDDGTTSPETLNARGTVLALQHLVDLGHQRIIHIAGPLEWISARNRAAAYARFLAEHGLPAFEAIPGDWTAASGYAAARSIPVDSGVTALVVANDQMAIGALRALHEAGRRVPEDVSVVGFDNVPESGFTIPPLTTVDQSYAAHGAVALDRLIDAIEGGEPRVPDEPELRLVVRSSTGRVVPV
jgi:DNA-binding LacI/PurR family transcriptional regulator